MPQTAVNNQDVKPVAKPHLGYFETTPVRLVERDQMY
jgi:hypothetical protein